MPIRLRSNFTSPITNSQSCIHQEYGASVQFINRHNTCHAFHSSCIHLNFENHYETLGLTPSTTAADIKKKFYELSKIYHPDRNPQDPEGSSKKFTAISNAYNILGNPTSREKYDHEQFPKSRPSGSYSSSQSTYSPGGRKASGLSRRRTQFRGPPPSYYRNAGATNQSQTKKTNENASGPDSAGTSGASSGPFAGQTGGSAGAWPFHTDPNDVPHFDRDGHYRATSSLADRMSASRQKRRAGIKQSDADFKGDSPGETIGKFFMVSALISVGVGVPALFLGGSSQT